MQYLLSFDKEITYAVELWVSNDHQLYEAALECRDPGELRELISDSGSVVGHGRVLREVLYAALNRVNWSQVLDRI